MSKESFSKQKFIASFENPQKRQSLASLEKQQSVQLSAQRSHLSTLPKLRVTKVFHYSPNHLQSVQQKKRDHFRRKKKPIPSKEEKDFSEILSYLKMKKVALEEENEKKKLQSQICQNLQHKCRQKKQINQDIQYSLTYINVIKKNKPLLKLPTQREAQIQKNTQYSTKQNFLGITDQKKKSGRMLTEPSLKSKTKQPIGLFSYLQRQYLDNKKTGFTPKQIHRYSLSIENRNFQRKLLEKSRIFLKQQTISSSKEYQNISEVLEDQSKNIIMKQIEKKKKLYQKQFKIRNNIPYLSFLSLNPKQKNSIIKQIQRKKLNPKIQF